MSESAHPLAEKFAREHPEGTLLLVGIGNGRNLLPFFSRRDPLVVIDADSMRLIRVMIKRKCDANHIRFIHTGYESLPFEAESISGILSTHVFQHGTPASIRSILCEVQRVLPINGSLSLVFASQRDPRFGVGTRIAEDCWAPTEGDEIGIPHLYLNETGIDELLTEHFSIQSLEEQTIRTSLGNWAHSHPQILAHWFVEALKK